MSNASFVHLNTILGARLYGDLINHAARTSVPVSDIVNRAVEDYLAAHATPEDRRGRYEIKEPSNSKGGIE